GGTWNELNRGGSPMSVAGRAAMTRRGLHATSIALAGTGGAMAAMALAGCGLPGRPEARSGPAAAPATLRYTTFWAQDRLQVLQPAVDEFQQTTGHTILMESVPNYQEKLVTEFVAGTAADVPHAHNQVMTKLFDQGVI